jgi:hypothetical protein
MRPARGRHHRRHRAPRACPPHLPGLPAIATRHRRSPAAGCWLPDRRAALALILIGDHTCLDVADLIGRPVDTVANLVCSFLRDIRRDADSDPRLHAVGRFRPRTHREPDRQTRKQHTHSALGHRGDHGDHGDQRDRLARPRRALVGVAQAVRMTTGNQVNSPAATCSAVASSAGWSQSV